MASSDYTARRSAVSAGPGAKPSSRAAFSWLTHIFLRAIRTASMGTRGGLPVTPAHAVLEIDLSAITFLDSSGLGALIALHKSMRSQNGTLRLVNPAPSASQIIELTRLHRVFEIVTR